MHSFTARLFSFVVLIGILGLVQGQAKSDFSGTWNLDTSKSDFGPLPSPDSMTETIVHKDPSLKVSLTQTGGLGDITMDLSYTTDGAECVNHVRQSEIRSILRWDGDDLVVDIKGKYGETDYKSKDRWTLSSDGKTLTITRHVSSPMGEADVKELFVKQ